MSGNVWLSRLDKVLGHETVAFRRQVCVVEEHRWGNVVVDVARRVLLPDKFSDDILYAIR